MENRILIAYYSWKGNTKRIAELIQKQTGGDLFEIKPAEAYTIDYNALTKQAKTEIRSGFLPELAQMPDTAPYTTIFLGTPNWWNTMAPPLASFISECDTRSKTIIPFLTHGGGGSGTIEKDISAMCPQAVMKKGFAVYNRGGSDVADEINDWLDKL
ncbi:MAG: flavodoxin [Deferribacterales bacterium]